MIQTDIQLSKRQVSMLNILSENEKTPVAALIQKAIDQYLAVQMPERSVLYDQAFSVLGKYKAGQSDISENHDRYLAKAFE